MPVRGDVVQNEDHHVAVRMTCDQPVPERDLDGEVETHTRDRGDGRVDPSVRGGGHVPDRHRVGTQRVVGRVDVEDALFGLAVDHGEDGPQDLVAVEDVADRPTKDARVDPVGQS